VEEALKRREQQKHRKLARELGAVNVPRVDEEAAGDEARGADEALREDAAPGAARRWTTRRRG
jgi:hypothetical protein